MYNPSIILIILLIRMMFMIMTMAMIIMTMIITMTMTMTRWHYFYSSHVGKKTQCHVYHPPVITINLYIGGINLPFPVMAGKNMRFPVSDHFQ
jgi:hypothetical protein